MNLIKLFNSAYLKENMKKSKGFIILFLILVPLFTVLITITEVVDTSSVNVFDTYQVGGINLVGMYVIPLVLSFSLFGYVFKKNSVDFINSMPINRKSIFVTNTIGGIILITLMQFITALILIICDAVLADLVIFTKMISDVFIFMWMAYVFVFIATNLAMTISGTFLTQVALTLLILFFIPFCIDGYNEFDNNLKYNLMNNDEIFSVNFSEQDVSYTMPYRVFSIIVTGSSEEFYSSNSITRMLVLSVLYFAMGLYLFQKRKMENNEESFSSIKMHVIVKALTIFPMIILLNILEPDWEFLLFALALISVYYFVFDYIVKRKVSFKISAISLIGIVIASQLICLGAGFIREKIPVRTLKKEDVKKVAIESCRSYENGSYFYYRDIFSNIDYYFDNQEIIDLIFDSGLYVNKMNKPNELDEEITKYEMVEVKNKPIEIEDENYLETSRISVVFLTKYGKKLEASIEILTKDLAKILAIVEKDEEYVKLVKERFIPEGEYLIEDILCTKEEQNTIKNEIEKILKETSIVDIYEKVQCNEDCAVREYSYENHELISKAISIRISEDLFKLATEKINKNTVEKVNEAMKEEIYRYFYVNISIEEERFYNSADFDNGVMEKFILQNANEKVDYNEKYYIIRGNMGKYGSIYFYTNKIDEIEKLIENNSQNFYHQIVD